METCFMAGSHSTKIPLVTLTMAASSQGPQATGTSGPRDQPLGLSELLEGYIIEHSGLYVMYSYIYLASGQV